MTAASLITLTVHMQMVRAFTLEPTGCLQVGSMSFQNYQKLWKAYVDVFKGILLTDETVGHANDGSPAGRRLGQLCLEAGRLRTCLCFAHPTRYIGYNYSMGEVCCALDLLPTLHTVFCFMACSLSCHIPSAHGGHWHLLRHGKSVCPGLAFRS
jgi:hypothetical protein